LNDVPRFPVPTWFVGCGNMGQAMVGGWRSAGVDLSSAVAIRPSGLPVTGVRTVASLGDAGAPPRLVVLGFKPQKLDEVAPQLRTRITGRTTVVSLLAGVEAATLRQRFPTAAAIVRAMPNTPVAIRRGVIALYSDDADDKTRTELSALFAPLGFAPWMADEAKFSAVGAVAGSGPAYVARFVTALIKAGEERGLSNEIASTIALETVLGTGWLAASAGESMDEIARRVTSPNGTTEAGLAVLDGKLDALVSQTIDAASERGRQLAEAARLP
jgi:pyrroline-5-carboxylate reductase